MPPDTLDDDLDLMRSSREALLRQHQPLEVSPLQGWSPGTPSSTDLPYTTKSGESSLGPHPAVTSAFSENFDADQLARNFYTQRGLKIGSLDPTHERDYRRWTLETQNYLQRSDPSWARLFKSMQDPASPDNQLAPHFAENLRILYLAQHAPPGSDELKSALTDAITDWHGSTRQEETALGHVRTVQEPEPPQPIDPDGLFNSYSKWLSEETAPSLWLPRGVSSFSDEDQRRFTYAKNHQDYYVARNRMEHLTGLPVGRGLPIQINYNNPSENRESLSFANRLAGSPYSAPILEPQEDKLTNVPSHADFSPEILASSHAGTMALTSRLGLIRQDMNPGGEWAQTLNDAWPKFVEAQLPKILDYFNLRPWVAKQISSGPQELLYSGAESAVHAVGKVFNWATLGFFEHSYDVLKQGTEVASEVLSGDRRFYEATLNGLPRSVYGSMVRLFDPRGTERLTRQAQFWQDIFAPDDPLSQNLDTAQRLSVFNVTQNALQRLNEVVNAKDHPWGNTVLHILGIDEPSAQTHLANIVHAFGDDSIPLLFGMLGVNQLWSKVGRFTPLAATGPLRDLAGMPARGLLNRFNRWTHLDQTLAQEGVQSSAANAPRAALVDQLTRQLNRMQRPSQAFGVLNDLKNALTTRVVDEEGRPLGPPQHPLDPQFTAGALDAMQNLDTRLQALTGTRLDDASKEALVALAPHIGVLDPMSALRVTTGKLQRVGPGETARTAAITLPYLEHLEKLPNMPWPDALLSVLGGSSSKAIEGVRKLAISRQEIFARRKSVLSVLDDLESQQRTLHSTLQDHLGELTNQRDAIRWSWNQQLNEIFTKWRGFEFNGGDRPRANPALSKKIYQSALSYQKHAQPAVGLENLVLDPELFTKVTGPEESTLLKGHYSNNVADKLYSNKRIRLLLDQWIQENSIPEIEHIAANPKPREDFATSMEKLLAKANDPYAPLISISENQKNVLNEYLTEPIKDHRSAEKLFNASTRDITKVRKELAGVEQFLGSTAGTAKPRPAGWRPGDLYTFREHVLNADPLNPETKVPVSDAFLKELETRLGHPAWLVGQRRYASIVPELSPLELSGVAAFKEATSKLRFDAETITPGLNRYGHLDFAIAHAIYPRWIPYMIRDQERSGQMEAALERYQIMRVQKLLGRDLKPGEWQELQVKIAAGDDSSPEAAKLLQNTRIRWLQKRYEAGGLSKEKMLEWITPDYYRGIYDPAKKLGDIPALNFNRPSKFGLLKTNPASEFMQSIPEDSYYVAWREGSKVRYQSGFKTQHEAEQWLSSEPASQRIPPGSEVAVRPPMPFAQKEARGLLVEAGYSQANLAENMGLHTANELLGQTFKKAGRPYVLTPDEAEAQGLRPLPNHDPGFIDSRTGDRYYRVTPGSGAPAVLADQFIHEKIIRYLEHTRQGYGWYQAITRPLQEEAGAWQRYLSDLGIGKRLTGNELLSWVDRYVTGLFGHAIPAPLRGLGHGLFRIAGNALALSRVALNPVAHIQQPLTNWLFNLPLGGMDTMTTHGMFYWWKFAKEMVNNNLSHAEDPTMEALIRANLVEQPKISFDNFQQKVLNDHWNSVSGFEARLDRNIREHALWQQKRATELFNGYPDKDKVAHYEQVISDLLTHRTFLETELNKKLQSETSSSLSKLGAWFRNNYVQLLRVPTIGGDQSGKFTEPLFSAFSFWDTASKYALVKYHMMNGLPLEHALDYASKFGQNLHRAPTAVRTLSESLGGNKFTTYPFNMAEVMGNAILLRPAALTAYLGRLWAWNYAAAWGKGRDPDQDAEAWSQSVGLGPANYFTRMLHGVGRVELPLPGAGSITQDPMWGWFLPGSQFGRALESKIMGSDQPALLKAAEAATTGLASKFVGGGVGMGFFNMALSGRDPRGNPIQGPLDFLQSAYQLVGSDLGPGGRDFQEIMWAATTPNQNPSTGEQHHFADYVLRRLFSVVPADHLNSFVTFRTALDAQLVASKKAGPSMSDLHYEDRLRTKLFAAGATRDLGREVNWDIARPIIDAHVKQDIIQKHLLDPNGVPIPIPKTDKQVSQLSENAILPSQLSLFKELSLADQINTYTNWRLYTPPSIKPDENLNDALLFYINKKARDPSPDEATVQELIPLWNSWTEDPRLPPDAKQHLDDWYSKFLLKYIHNKAAKK